MGAVLYYMLLVGLGLLGFVFDVESNPPDLTSISCNTTFGCQYSSAIISSRLPWSSRDIFYYAKVAKAIDCEGSKRSEKTMRGLDSITDEYSRIFCDLMTCALLTLVSWFCA